jgi:hypothetical protein
MHTATATSSVRPRDLYVALMPARAYQELVAVETEATMASALARPALFAVLVGVSVAIAATGQVSPVLLVSTTISWSWVVAVQLIFALLMTQALPRDGHVSAARALELWFAGHVPWTLWVLMLGPLLRALPETSAETLIVSALVPMAWTAAIAAAFGRVVLRQSDGLASLRAALHQLVLLGVILSFVAWSAGGWFRIVG